MVDSLISRWFQIWYRGFKFGTTRDKASKSGRYASASFRRVQYYIHLNSASPAETVAPSTTKSTQRLWDQLPLYPLIRSDPGRASESRILKFSFFVSIDYTLLKTLWRKLSTICRNNILVRLCGVIHPGSLKHIIYYETTILSYSFLNLKICGLLIGSDPDRAPLKPIL